MVAQAHDDRRVLIAGGGIAGLALARALLALDIPCVAFERQSAVSSAGLAINLPGNAIRALATLGFADDLQGLGSPIKRREYRNERGRLLFSVDEAAFWGDGAQPRCVRRSDLMHLLAHGLPAESCRMDCGVVSVEQNTRGVQVGLSDGSVETGGFLAGADGVRSTVRRLVFGEHALGAAVLAEASWRFMAPNPGIDCWTAWTGADGTFLLIPVDRGEVYGWVASAAKLSGGRDLASLQHVFKNFPGIVRETLATVLTRPTQVHHSPLEEVRIPAWSKDFVSLVGDAAHATAPVWAQGAALSLEDALVLARLLAHHEDWAHVGADYERQRRPRVAHVQDMTDRLSRAANMPTAIRDILLPFMGPRSYRTTYGLLRDCV